MTETLEKAVTGRLPLEVWSATTSALFAKDGVEIHCSSVQMTGSLRASADEPFTLLQQVIDVRETADNLLERQRDALHRARRGAEMGFSDLLNDIEASADERQSGGELVRALSDDLFAPVRQSAELVQSAATSRATVYQSTAGRVEESARRWLASSLLPPKRLVAQSIQVSILSEGFEGGIHPASFVRAVADLLAEGSDGSVDEALRDFVEGALSEFRVPTFGSPPEKFTGFGQLLAGGSYIGGFGSLIAGQGVWVAIASVSMGIVLQIATPGIDNLARKVDTWSADKLDLPPE